MFKIQPSSIFGSQPAQNLQIFLPNGQSFKSQLLAGHNSKICLIIPNSILLSIMYNK